MAHGHTLRFRSFVALTAVIGVLIGMFAALIARGVLADSASAEANRQARAYAADWAGTTDLSNLQLGDGKTTTLGPKRGWVFTCPRDPGAPGGGPPMKQPGGGPPMKQPGGGPPGGGPPGQNVARPWVHGSTWNYYEKAQVSGAVSWPAALKMRSYQGKIYIQGNGLPTHYTGTFPIQSYDFALQYDPNPNPIRQYTINVALPIQPTVSARPNCLPPGPIGIMTSGAPFFSALDEQGHDAPAREMQDGCSGHPQQQGMYHYHALPACINSGPAGHPSRVIGWAVDGFPITGPRGANGVTYTNAMLDACHGTTGPVTVGSRIIRMYHYVATMEFPYTLGCLRGRSVVRATPPPRLP